MKLHYLPVFFTSFVLVTPLTAQQEAPEKALKYHEALLKRPQNSTLLDRFFSAWIDEQPIETLDVFLKNRAEKNGGQDLAILAQHQLRRGLEDEALQTLGKAITALPDEVYLPMERAKIQLRRLDFEAARTDLEKVAQGKDPLLTLEATKLIGKSWLREGNSGKAIETWDKLLAANPKDEDLLEDLVESAAAEGEIDQALTYAQKLIDVSSDPYKKTLRQLRQGDLLAQAGRNDDAVKNYSGTLAQVGEGSWLEREILAQIDKTFRKQDRLNDLKNAFIQLAEANPRRLLIHRQLAKLEADQGDVDSAVGRFREVLKRSPGNQELLEEFIRLLTDSEKYEDASEEVNKLIAQAPDSTALLLQLADIQHRQNNKEATTATLEKTLKLFGPDETSGIRIASLMFQYGNQARGEEILKNLSAAQNATTAPAEALASQYARNNRKAEAIEIFKKIAEDPNLDIILRAAGAISALGDSNTSFELLNKKIEAHNQDPRFLAAITQAALTSEKKEEAIKHAIRLVRISKQTADIAQSIELAMRAITAADQAAQWTETLDKQESKTPAEICLYAALTESSGDFDKVEKLMVANSDPVVIRFHCIILERRGEWNEAITVLNRLADTDEGRKASFFKDLSELQRNAGLTKDALATIERWKQSAPTDKTAWITGSSILRENAQTDEAVQMIRQAVSRFKEDTDLSANLAQLHEETGQLPEALSIYWQLYDNSEKPADQARWATNLAKIASQTGRTQELEEQLRDRARNNRRSIGPLLAQAELARLTQNEDKRRDLLLEAVRLQPNNVDLRLQIANLEEQSGNPDRVIAILEEAVAADNTGRIRNSLAQAYLRQGQILKGMRELQKITGTQATDPRAIESNAASLASSGLYDEGIRYLRESLPDGGDWRTKYLLAIMLEQDGRESEAIPLFQSLLQVSEEIPSLTIKTNLNQNSREEDYWDEYPESMRDIMQLMSAGQAAYMHRSEDRSHYSYSSSNNSMTQLGIFALPNESKILRSFTKIHLAKINPTGIENASFIKDLLNSGSDYQPNFGELLKKYPDYPGVFELALAYSSWNEETQMNVELLRTQLANNKSLTNSSRFQIYLHLIHNAEPNDPVWQDMVKISEEIAKSDKPTEAIQLGYMLMQILREKEEETVKLPDAIRKSLTDTLIGLTAKDFTEHDPMGNFKLVAIHTAGSQEQWIKAVNESIKAFREEKKPQDPSRRSMNYNYSYSNYSNSNSSPFIIPQINTLSLRSLPGQVIHMIQPAGARENYYGYEMPDPKNLIAHLDKFESPTLRAWIAIRAEDQTAIEKSLTATPPDQEATDFKTLQAYHAISKKDFAGAYKIFSELRPAYSSDRNLTNWLNISLVAIANEMKPEERTPLTEELRTLLIQCRANLGLQGAPALAAQAEKFGMSDLAKRFVPQSTGRINPGAANLGPAAFAPANASSSSSSGGNASIDKMKKFASDGKTEAAALEALNLVRKAYKSTYNRSYEISEIKENITPEVIKELVKICDPGESNSLTKLLEYADICSDFGKRDTALQILIKLNKERPDDMNISAKLAFLLPADQQKLAIELIAKSASKDEFINIAASTAEYLSESEDTSSSFNFFSTIAAWLQSADPKQLEETNLSWIAYSSISFFEGNYNDDIPALIQEKPQGFKNSKTYDEFVTIAKNLATAMLRHPATAEEGFRLLGASHAWKIEDSIRDEQARQLFLATKVKPKTRIMGYRGGDDQSYFALRTSNNSSGSGEQLESHASVKWISDRLITAKSPDDILPPAYLKQLREHDPIVGDLIAALANLKTIKELDAYWKSDILKNTSGPFPSMCRTSILSLARHIPESSAFFIDRINELTPNEIEEARYNPSNSVISLFQAALISASSQKDPAHLTKTSTTISQKIFGDKIDLNSAKDSMNIYAAINLIENIFEDSNMGPVETIRIINSFYQLGIPAGQSEYQITQAFDDISIKDVNEAVKIFTSYGWLNDIETWEPFSAIIVDANHTGGNEIKLIRKEQFLMPRAISNINTNITTQQIISHLEELKPQTFGNLITAACMADTTKRSQLTDQAFQLAAAKITKIKPEQAKAFTPLLPWLPNSAIDKLPETFKESLGQSKAERITKLIQQADEYLKAPQNSPFGYQRPFDEIEEILPQLAELDLKKAVEIFIEADKRFTDSLTRGGRLSSWTTQTLQVIERDKALSKIIFRKSEYGHTNPPISLAFHKAIVSSPIGSRFSYASSEPFTPVLFYVGRDLHNFKLPDNKINNSTIQALRNVDKLPADLHNDAYISIGTYLIGYKPQRDAVQIQRDRDELKQNADLPELAKHIRNISIGVSKWSSDSPQGRITTRDSINYLANFKDVAESTRFQLIFLCAFMESSILSDPAIAEIYTKSFETYASGERSIINFLGIYAQTMLASAPSTPEILPFISRINQAFWNNANSPKSGGHPVIPPSMVSSLLISTAAARDEESITKLVNKVRPQVLGDANLIFKLIDYGYFNLAKQLLCPSDRYHPLPKTMPSYNSGFEKQYIEFRKDPAINPISLLRYDAILLDLCDDTAPKYKAAESRADREKRIIASYLANPPKELFLRTEIVSRLIRDSHTAAIALKDEVIAIRNKLNLQKSLDDWAQGNGNPTDLIPLHMIAPAETAIFRQAAFLELLDGDASSLTKLIETILTQPAKVNRGRYGNNQYISEYVARIITSAPIWIIEAVHQDKTSGFKDAYAPLAKLALFLDSSSGLYSNIEIQRAVTASEFLAFWNNDPNSFNETRKQIKNTASVFKYLDQRKGLTYFCKFGMENKAWNRDSFAEPRHNFLIKIFTKPEMAPYFGQTADLISQTANSANLKENFLKIAANPPENLTIEASHHLLTYYAEQEFHAKRFDTGLAAIIKAIETCPTEGPWKEVHFRTCIATTDRLIKAKQMDQAKKIHDMIKVETLNPHQTKRYEENAKKFIPPAN